MVEAKSERTILRVLPDADDLVLNFFKNRSKRWNPASSIGMSLLYLTTFGVLLFTINQPGGQPPIELPVITATSEPQSPDCLDSNIRSEDNMLIVSGGPLSEDFDPDTLTPQEDGCQRTIRSYYPDELNDPNISLP